MKLQSKKVVAVALAMTMCVPATAFGMATPGNATRGTDANGTFNTDFGVYSPTLTVSVPVDANIRINPIADSTDTTVKKFKVASNSIDIINATVDGGKGIPVNATVNAWITNKGEGVITKYQTFTSDTSATKKVFLNLAQAGTAATLNTDNAAFDATNNLNLSTVKITGEANYTSPTKTVPVTAYGSQLAFQIAKPTVQNNAAAPSDITPTVGSFAVTGEANAEAPWTDNDLTVYIAYNIKASNTVPAAPAAATDKAESKGTNVTFDVTGIGNADVSSVALHNEEKYADAVLKADDSWTVVYDRTTAGSEKATITIKKEDAMLAWFNDDLAAAGAEHEIVVTLSDGQVVVLKLTLS